MDEKIKLRLFGIIILTISMICLLLTGTFGSKDNLLQLNLGDFYWLEDVVYVMSALSSFVGGIIILKTFQKPKQNLNDQ